MKTTKLALIALTIMSAQPVNADISFYFNPFAWARAIQRAYFWKKYPQKMQVALDELKTLHQINFELDNFQKKVKILRTINNPMVVVAFDRLNNEFAIAQRKWNLSSGIYYTTSIERVQAIVDTAIKRTEQEVGETEKPLSWYKQLKEDEKNLSRSDRNQSAKQRAETFKAWQQKYSALRKPIIIKNIINEMHNLTVLHRAYFPSFEKLKQLGKAEADKSESLPDLQNLVRHFRQRQAEWEKQIAHLNLDHDKANCRNYFSNLSGYKEKVFNPAVAKSLEEIKEQNAAVESWAEKLKKDAMKSDKTDDMFHEEFRKWQSDNKRTKLELSKGSMDLKSARSIRVANESLDAIRDEL